MQKAVEASRPTDVRPAPEFPQVGAHALPWQASLTLRTDGRVKCIMGRWQEVSEAKLGCEKPKETDERNKESHITVQRCVLLIKV